MAASHLDLYEPLQRRQRRQHHGYSAKVTPQHQRHAPFFAPASSSSSSSSPLISHGPVIGRPSPPHSASHKDDDDFMTSAEYAARMRDHVIRSSTLAPLESEFKESHLLPGGRQRAGRAGGGSRGASMLSRNVGHHVVDPLPLIASRNAFIESTVPPEAQETYADAELNAYRQYQLEEYYDPDDPALDVLPRGGPSTRRIMGDRRTKWRGIDDEDGTDMTHSYSPFAPRPEMLDRTRTYFADSDRGRKSSLTQRTNNNAKRHMMVRQMQHAPAHMRPTVFDGPERDDWIALKQFGEALGAAGPRGNAERSNTTGD